MNVIKRHKGLAIVGSLTLILFIIIFIILSRMIFSSSDSNYGDRLNNIVSIDKEETKKLISEIEEYSEVEKVSVDVKGKIIYIIINVSNATSKDRAKEIASKTVEYYSEEVIGCYDFEFLIKQNMEVKEGEEDTSYSLAGAKKVDNENISWVRN